MPKNNPSKYAEFSRRAKTRGVTLTKDANIKAVKRIGRGLRRAGTSMIAAARASGLKQSARRGVGMNIARRLKNK